MRGEEGVGVSNMLEDGEEEGEDEADISWLEGSSLIV